MPDSDIIYYILCGGRIIFVELVLHYFRVYLTECSHLLNFPLHVQLRKPNRSHYIILPPLLVLAYFKCSLPQFI